jgi:hypothetical protein
MTPGKEQRTVVCPGPPRCLGPVTADPACDVQVSGGDAVSDRARLDEILLRLSTLGDESWKEPGHPMNSWVGKETVQRLAREAIEIVGRLGKEGGL